MTAVSLGTNGFITTRAVNERPVNTARVWSKVSSVEVDSFGGAGAGGAGVGVGAGGGVWAEAEAGTASATRGPRPARLMRPPWPARTGPALSRRRRRR